MRFMSLIVCSCLSGSPIVAASGRQERFHLRSVLRGRPQQVVDPTPLNDDDAFPPNKDNYWFPMGQTLNGIDKETWDSTAYKVALSYHDGSLDDAAGLTLAQAYPIAGNRGINSYRGGKILTYTYVPRLRRWIPFDDPIYVGDIADLAMNDNMLAFSQMSSNGRSPAIWDSQVHVYEICSSWSSNGRVDTGWCLVGPEIQNDSSNKEQEIFGFSISANHQHGLVAVGTVFIDWDPSLSPTGNGRVEVFRFDYSKEEPSWTRSGNPILGDHAEFGQVVKLSADGKVLSVLGSYSIDEEMEDIQCLIRVYEWSENKKDWVQMGQDIMDKDGQGPDKMSCDNMDMSKDGTTILAGARQQVEDFSLKGHVRVWSYDRETKSWLQKGEDLDTLVPMDDGRKMVLVGMKLSISDNGNRVVMSEQSYPARHIEENKVWTFDWDGQRWDHKKTGSIRTNGTPCDLHMANQGENLVMALPEAMDGYGAVMAFKLNKNGPFESREDRGMTPTH